MEPCTYRNSTNDRHTTKTSRVKEKENGKQYLMLHDSSCFLQKDEDRLHYRKSLPDHVRLEMVRPERLGFLRQPYEWDKGMSRLRYPPVLFYTGGRPEVLIGVTQTTIRTLVYLSKPYQLTQSSFYE